MTTSGIGADEEMHHVTPSTRSASTAAGGNGAAGRRRSPLQGFHRPCGRGTGRPSGCGDGLQDGPPLGNNEKMKDDPLMAGRRLAVARLRVGSAGDLAAGCGPTGRVLVYLCQRRIHPRSSDPRRHRGTVQEYDTGHSGRDTWRRLPGEPRPARLWRARNCRYCDFQRICPTNKLALWARKGDSPEAAAYKMLSRRRPRRRCGRGRGMMQLEQPSDQPRRDRIQQGLDENLFVEAGAGTGKTTALVGRIVTLIASGAAEMAGLAAITFTRGRRRGTAGSGAPGPRECFRGR